MAEASDTKGILYQNLLDAGCDKELIEECMDMIQSGRRREVLLLLSSHKNVLLRKVHISQKQIDCLDFLTYKIEKNNI